MTCKFGDRIEYQLPNLLVGAITKESLYNAFENGITADQVNTISIWTNDTSILLFFIWESGFCNLVILHARDACCIRNFLYYVRIQFYTYCASSYFNISFGIFFLLQIVLFLQQNAHPRVAEKTPVVPENVTDQVYLNLLVPIPPLFGIDPNW